MIAVIEQRLRRLAPDHPVREALAELKELFEPPRAARASLDEVRALLDQVPGSLRTKAARIGIHHNSIHNLLHGRFTASPTTIAKIKAAIPS